MVASTGYRPDAVRHADGPCTSYIDDECAVWAWGTIPGGAIHPPPVDAAQPQTAACDFAN